MSRSHAQANTLKGILLWAVLGIALGALFPLLAFGMEPGPIVNGMIVGFLVGTIGSIVELLIFQERFRRLSFSLVLVVRVIFYLALISSSTVFVIAFYQSRRQNISLSEVFVSPEFLNFLTGGEFYFVLLYTAIAGIIINFLRQINRLLGQRVLLNYITGKYHRPVEEERIFMFLDITSSTTIAERLGHLLYHQFINDFFYDITRPIVEHDGEIYQYVGDEVIVTWTPKKGLRNAECIACYFDICTTISIAHSKYQEKYGVVPTFKAGFHIGEVITAEVGDIKKAISFHGDVVNTASRIQAECRVLGKDLLVSRELLDRLPDTPDYRREFVGAIRLRGKEHDVELFSLGRLSE